MHMKLLALGVVMLLAAVAMLIFSDFNPATLFIGGGVCTFIGIINLISSPYEPGPGVSAGGDASPGDFI